MDSFVGNIEELVLENDNFRKVIFTAPHSQLVLMMLKPLEEIGQEVHEDNDQFFRFEKGIGKCVIEGEEYALKDGVAIVIPAGTQHNIINTSQTDNLYFYTIYSPAHHPDGTIHHLKP